MRTVMVTCPLCGDCAVMVEVDTDILSGYDGEHHVVYLPGDPAPCTSCGKQVSYNETAENVRQTAEDEDREEAQDADQRSRS